MLTLLVIVAAAIGSVCRYLADMAVKARVSGRFPWGTLVVNVSGAFVLGVITGLATHHGLNQSTTLVLSAGFAGGYTTWSTLMWESLALAETRAVALAAANAFGSLAVGLVAAALGLALTQG